MQTALKATIVILGVVALMGLLATASSASDGTPVVTRLAVGGMCTAALALAVLGYRLLRRKAKAMPTPSEETIRKAC